MASPPFDSNRIVTEQEEGRKIKHTKTHTRHKSSPSKEKAGFRFLKLFYPIHLFSFFLFVVFFFFFSCSFAMFFDKRNEITSAYRGDSSSGCRSIARRASFESERFFPSLSRIGGRGNDTSEREKKDNNDVMDDDTDVVCVLCWSTWRLGWTGAGSASWSLSQDENASWTRDCSSLNRDGQTRQGKFGGTEKERETKRQGRRRGR